LAAGLFLVAEDLPESKSQKEDESKSGAFQEGQRGLFWIYPERRNREL